MCSNARQKRDGMRSLMSSTRDWLEHPRSRRVWLVSLGKDQLKRFLHQHDWWLQQIIDLVFMTYMQVQHIRKPVVVALASICAQYTTLRMQRVKLFCLSARDGTSLKAPQARSRGSKLEPLQRCVCAVKISWCTRAVLLWATTVGSVQLPSSLCPIF